MGSEALIVQAAKTSVTQQAGAYQVPWPLLTVTNALTSAHLYWMILRNVHFYSSAKKEEDSISGSTFLYGAAIQTLSNTNEILKNCLKLVLIAKGIDELVDQHVRLYLAYQNFKNAIFETYPSYRIYQWKKPDERTSILLSPAYDRWVDIYVIGTCSRIANVSKAASKVFWEMCNLSMHYTELHMIANGDHLTTLFATTRLVFDIQEYDEKTNEDKGACILGELEGEKLVVDSFLRNVGATENYSYYITQIKGCFKVDWWQKIQELYFTAPTQRSSEIPPGRYPHWIGQKVNIKNGSNPPDELSKQIQTLLDKGQEEVRRITSQMEEIAKKASKAFWGAFGYT